jgi:hypothetical protein
LKFTGLFQKVLPEPEFVVPGTFPEPCDGQLSAEEDRISASCIFQKSEPVTFGTEVVTSEMEPASTTGSAGLEAEPESEMEPESASEAARRDVEARQKHRHNRSMSRI